MHLRNQPRDALTSRRNIPIRRHVVLARTATVVTNLIGQNLVRHIHIITRRRPPPQRRAASQPLPKLDTVTRDELPPGEVSGLAQGGVSAPARPSRSHSSSSGTAVHCRPLLWIAVNANRPKPWSYT